MKYDKVEELVAVSLTNRRFEDMGFKVGDEFVSLADNGSICIGNVIRLVRLDGTCNPYFSNVEGGPEQCMYSNMVARMPNSKKPVKAHRSSIITKKAEDTIREEHGRLDALRVKLESRITTDKSTLEKVVERISQLGKLLE